ncbi:WecB/TagA/CpsF family glycosyltransferase [Pedobacter frigoris]|uniref:WecB/TagA/CpsF family glycosyltransferase n=1 Tax=Pedobacter frigoris TaxID=2571272 RepID=UPI00292FC7D7|nr:WecB/TagA/CpsF family glycosyltransferase [Pedobacter frigoris]
MTYTKMNAKTRILMSIPSRSHVEIALDELTGLQDLGYECEGFSYAAKEGTNSKLGRLFTILYNAVHLVLKSYRFKPDIIYFNSRLELIACTRDWITVVLFRMLYFKKVRLMIKSHGSDLEVLEATGFFMKNVVLSYLRKQISAWLFLSSEEKTAIIKNGFLPSERIFVTKNIVRGLQFRKDENFRTKLGIPADCTILLFAGRFIREKGVYEIIDAFAELVKKYEVALILVGDGPEMQGLQQQAVLKEIGHKITFTGIIPEKDVATFYANSDILVFPTYCQEGFPMALFNSVAAGLSIVTTPIRAATDYLTAPENCLWVEPKNKGSVEVALSTLLDSPELRQQMHLENLQKGKAFNKEKVCAEISSIIETITGSDQQTNFLVYNVFSKSLAELRNESSLMINTINQYSYCIAEKDSVYKKALKASDVLLPDGIGVVWAARLLTGTILKKIAGADVHEYLLKELNQKSGSCFYLGASTDTLQLIKSKIADIYPNISIGTFSPPFKAVFSEDDNREMINAVNNFHPDVLFVGMTAPKQEKWSFEHRKSLDAKVICTIGAVFDFYAGTIKRPDQVWIDYGLEWFVRLLKEPRRLSKRYLYYGPVFIYYILKEKTRQTFK